MFLTMLLRNAMSRLLAMSPEPTIPMATDESEPKRRLHTAGCIANTPGRQRWQSQSEMAKAFGPSLLT